ncbi:AAA family ATPase [Planococcus sp. FY231025]|uniref:AAA family ATPase n=1 Tax=Planococcus sp. FY231025 TaxID=3455699 RepID=UPI003F92E871
MKIQIIGGSGTGKSTLAQFISEKENVKWIDTDEYLWKDTSFTELYPIEKRREMYQRDMELYDEYIVSGSVFSWCPNGFHDRDLLVFLTLDESVRMQRLRLRETERNSPVRPDENGEMTNDFLEWCKTYLTAGDKNSIGTYAEHMHQMEISTSPVIKLDSSFPVEVLYAEILKFYKEKVKCSNKIE